MKRLAIIGGGSWGTALAVLLAPRFESVGLWVYEADLAGIMAESRENPAFLAGFRLPPNVRPSNDIGAAVAGAEIVLGVMPSQHARAVYTQAKPFLEADAVLVSATKGLETASLLRMSEVAGQVLGDRPVAVLSGPTFAREIARGEPAAVVIASTEPGAAAAIQRAFSGPTFRLYTNTDVAGVEMGAALKNVIAIGAGVVHGLGLGSNTMAALITRGLAEMTRLAVGMGGEPRTLAGLAGLGDLVLTCTGELSRNRRVGVELAAGRSLPAIVESSRMVAEGIRTTFAAMELAQARGVDMPITAQMEAIFRNGKPPRDAIRELMERSLKGE